MTAIETLRARRAALLTELTLLEEVRRGSITPQYVQAVKKDGAAVTRGPYPVYTFKEKGKTVSRRLKLQEVDDYREQIHRFRRFQELTEELRVIGEKLSDLALDPALSQKKTTKSAKSKSNGPPK